MKKVLVIANPYKPMETIGTKRITKFLKYMDGTDWEPTVIAPMVKGAKEYDSKQPFKTMRLLVIGLPYIYSLARKLFPKKRNSAKSVSNKPAQVVSRPRSTRARSAILNDWLFIPDEYVLWALYAAVKGIRYVKKNNIDLCFVSGPRFSTLVAGAIISKYTKVKLVSDFRDPWLGSEFIKYKTKSHYRMNKALERFVVKQSDKVLSIAPHMHELFLERYPKEDPEKFAVLYNGYDKDDVKEVKEEIGVEGTKPNADSTIVITHTGTFYGERNPDTFLKGLALAQKNNPDLQVKVNFVGGIDKIYFDYAINHGIDAIDVGRVSYEESLSYQKQSDILLLIPGPGKTTITGKVFEYLYAKKPILCIGIPDSNLDYLLNYTDSGFLANVESPEDIAEKIAKLAEYIKGNQKPFSFAHIEEFDFKQITQELTKTFDVVLHQQSMAKQEDFQ